MAIESWVSSWYSEYVQENQQAPSYNDYVAEGGKASLQEYFDWQFNAPALNAVKTSTNVIYPSGIPIPVTSTSTSTTPTSQLTSGTSQASQYPISTVSATSTTSTSATTTPTTSTTSASSGLNIQTIVIALIIFGALAYFIIA